MKAYVLQDFGSIGNLKIENITKPGIKDDEVLIETKAVSINPVDVKTRQNKTALAEELAELKPIILGWHVSGIVVEKGAKAGNFEIGQEVFGMINFTGHGKAYAQYVAARSDQIALKPENITHEQAAASCMAALTAWQAFNYFMKLGKNEKSLFMVLLVV